MQERKRAQKPVDWDLVYLGLRAIAKSLPRTPIEAIVGFPRGGMALATCLAHLLDVKKVMTTPEFHLRNAHQLLDAGTYVLLDDISDTGNTFKSFYQTLASEGLSEKVSIINVSLYWRPGTGFMPEVTVCCAFEDWIVFPWEHSPVI